MTVALPGNVSLFWTIQAVLSGPHDKLGLSLLIASTISVSVNTTVSRTLVNYILGTRWDFTIINNTSCSIEIIKHICFHRVGCNYCAIAVKQCTDGCLVLNTTVNMFVKFSQVVRAYNNDALDVLCAQLTRNLFEIAKFLFHAGQMAWQYSSGTR